MVGPPRHPRPAGRGRGADGDARPRAGPPHRRHASTSSTCPPAGSVELVAGGQGDGLPVTAEATPHHFTLTDERVPAYDPVFKVNPPLRTDADVAAVKAGLADGTIDAIATDHAPHTAEAKEAPFDQAPPGMLGLETALALALTELDLPIGEVLAAAVVAAGGRSPGSATSTAARSPTGRPANLCVIDPEVEWTVSGTGHGQPQPQHALRGHASTGPGPPHAPARRAGRHRRARPNDDGELRALSRSALQGRVLAAEDRQQEALRGVEAARRWSRCGSRHPG